MKREEIKMSITTEQILEHLSGLNALEAKQLADAIQEKFGITEIAMGGGAGAGTGAAEASAAATEFDIKITAVAQKLAAVKYLKEKGKSLGEAKAYLEDDNRPLLSAFLGVKKYSEAEAAALVKELSENGATAELVS